MSRDDKYVKWKLIIRMRILIDWLTLKTWQLDRDKGSKNVGAKKYVLEHRYGSVLNRTKVVELTFSAPAVKNLDI